MGVTLYITQVPVVFIKTLLQSKGIYNKLELAGQTNAVIKRSSGLSSQISLFLNGAHGSHRF